MSIRLLAVGFVAVPGVPVLPGSAVASVRNRFLMLYPAFADVSMNKTPSSRAFLSPSSVLTWLQHNKLHESRCNIHISGTLKIYTPSVRQVSFVSNEHDNDVCPSLCAHILNPTGHIAETGSACRQGLKIIARMSARDQLVGRTYL
jgi:hypothetical protein